MKNYTEALEHMFTVDMLNKKGLRDYIKILKSKITELKISMIDKKI